MSTRVTVQCMCRQSFIHSVKQTIGENTQHEFFFFSFRPNLDKDILLSANWSYNLNQAFIDNYGLDPELTWQYFCSQTGLYRVWPGHIWEYPEGAGDKLDLFDCRVQNWYIRATSSPRDVIILIDASGSMTGLKKSIAIQTVETILDTLSDDDFVQIIKVKRNIFSIFNSIAF